jgi:metallo-beta-lactamase family protein
MIKIQFIGATDDVTGSMTLLQNDKGKILIDCGLYQGISDIVKKNLEELPFNPREISAIILTHAHLDHSGFIPRLIKLGFHGSIFCTKATMKLAHLIMEDSAKIIEKEEDHILNSFYGIEDVIKATSFFKVKKFNESFELLGMNITLLPAGHILGAATVQINSDKKIIFSGDLGRSDDPLISAPGPCPQADYLIMESTYGGKTREGNLNTELSHFLKKIRNESKIGLVASFAVARAQLLTTLIYLYFSENPNDKFKIVMDGPMMAKANKIYSAFADDTKMGEILKRALEEIEVIDHESEWESIKKEKGPLLVISSSGMISGGRIWRYLENWKDDENVCLFLPGYQAAGTAGRELKEGRREIHNGKNKIHWSGEVITSDAFSSHADQNELLSWIRNLDKKTNIFLNHGEEESKLNLQKKISTLGFQHVQIAKANKVVKL